ncbi:hypothetical protein Dthio_PD1736 [Desulfonatronospira thiodismutans ASO3-1]|uniref:Uncharacterized protein n=1 Tax=Desulfonatronospira thiodismutans ASO3-1 TaxID=555779 RepID=D6SNQ8_9BACT|nr:hypothetical protein [Desulfonatronospira thiodismutans]EFI34384.1 hypothetical protein Dthio_PD1736 [Desulfonatronospira thiodismutans ASO3-1]
MLRQDRLKRVAIGAGRIFDFAGSYDLDVCNKFLRTDSDTLDHDAVRSDWDQVGNDLKEALSREADTHRKQA